MRALVTADLAAGFMASGVERGAAAGLIDLQYRARHDQYARRFPDAEQVMIEVDGIPIGLMLTADDNHDLRLVDLIVDARQRGQGIGTHALESLCARADRQGLAIVLSVWSQNDGARRLYERFGFVAADAATSGYLSMRRAAVEVSP